MKICILLMTVLFSHLVRAQLVSFSPVKNWMALAKVTEGGQSVNRTFIRTRDGKVKYFDMMKNLRPFEGISGIRQIVSGNNNFILALREDGTVWAWGSNTNGQLGNQKLVEKRGRVYSFKDSNKPVPVSGLSDVMAVSAYNNTCYALKTDGTVWTWGNARSGLTANGQAVLHYMYSGEEGYAVAPEMIRGLTDVIDISGPMALLSNGTVMTWGENNYGQLGNQGAQATSTPQKIKGLTNVMAICSNHHGMRMVLKEDGSLWAWGENRHGRSGVGKNAASDHVMYVDKITRVPGIKDGLLPVTGQNTNLLLLRDGSVKGWGDGRLGSLAMRAEDVTAPRRIPGIKNAVGLYIGTYAGFALLADGTVMAWGDGFRDGGHLEPTRIAALGDDMPRF